MKGKMNYGKRSSFPACQRSEKFVKKGQILFPRFFSSPPCFPGNKCLFTRSHMKTAVCNDIYEVVHPSCIAPGTVVGFGVRAQR